MPKPKAIIDPSDVRHPSVALDLAMEGKRANPDRSQLAYIHDRYWELKRNMDLLTHRDDGWLRIVPQADTDRLYIKWKFTGGPHAGKYIMAVVQLHQLYEGLMLIVHKALQVDQGLLKPVVDRPHDSEA